MSGFMNADGSALVGGLLPLNGGQALQLDALGNLTTTTAVGIAVLNGQSFTATSGKQTVAASANGGFSIFNPAANSKNILLYSIKQVLNGGNLTTDMRLVTTDPALGTSAVVANNKAGGAASSLSSVSFALNGITPVGTAFDGTVTGTNVTLEFLNNGAMILLPAGFANGVVLYHGFGAVGTWFTTVKWLEF